MQIINRIRRLFGIRPGFPAHTEVRYVPTPCPFTRAVRTEDGETRSVNFLHVDGVDMLRPEHRRSACDEMSKLNAELAAIDEKILDDDWSKLCDEMTADVQPTSATALRAIVLKENAHAVHRDAGEALYAAMLEGLDVEMRNRGYIAIFDEYNDCLPIDVDDALARAVSLAKQKHLHPDAPAEMLEQSIEYSMKYGHATQTVARMLIALNALGIGFKKIDYTL